MTTKTATCQTSDFQIRAMGWPDFTVVMINENAAYKTPWTEVVMTDCLSVGYSCWVMDSPSGVIGHGIISMAAGEAHVLNLCIHPNHQGLGLGRVLLRHLLDEVLVKNTEIIFLEVRPSNVNAIQLYESMGFQQVGVRPNYYPDGPVREDAWVFAYQVLPFDDKGPIE